MGMIITKLENVGITGLEMYLSRFAILKVFENVFFPLMVISFARRVSFSKMKRHIPLAISIAHVQPRYISLKHEYRDLLQGRVVLHILVFLFTW